MNVHLFHEARITNSWKTNMEGEVPLHWRRRNLEKEEGGRTVWRKIILDIPWWLYKTVLCRGIKEADIKASYPRGSSSFQR